MTPFKKTHTLALLAVVGVLATVACQAPAPPAAPAAPDHAAELSPVINAFFEVWNTAEYDKLDNIMDANYQRVAPDQNADGREAMIEFMRQVHATYAGFHIARGESAYAKDLSFHQWTVTGTVTAEDGAETAIEVTGTTMLRFAGGLITEEIVYYDTAAITNQLGVSEVPHAE